MDVIREIPMLKMMEVQLTEQLKRVVPLAKNVSCPNLQNDRHLHEEPLIRIKSDVNLSTKTEPYLTKSYVDHAPMPEPPATEDAEELAQEINCPICGFPSPCRCSKTMPLDAGKNLKCCQHSCHVPHTTRRFRSYPAENTCTYCHISSPLNKVPPKPSCHLCCHMATCSNSAGTHGISDGNNPSRSIVRSMHGYPPPPSVPLPPLPFPVPSCPGCGIFDGYNNSRTTYNNYPYSCPCSCSTNFSGLEMNQFIPPLPPPIDFTNAFHSTPTYNTPQFNQFQQLGSSCGVPCGLQCGQPCCQPCGQPQNVMQFADPQGMIGKCVPWAGPCFKHDCTPVPVNGPIMAGPTGPQVNPHMFSCMFPMGVNPFQGSEQPQTNSKTTTQSSESAYKDINPNLVRTYPYSKPKPTTAKQAQTCKYSTVSETENWNTGDQSPWYLFDFDPEFYNNMGFGKTQAKEEPPKDNSGTFVHSNSQYP